MRGGPNWFASFIIPLSRFHFSSFISSDSLVLTFSFILICIRSEKPPHLTAGPLPLREPSFPLRIQISKQKEFGETPNSCIFCGTDFSISLNLRAFSNESVSLY